MQRTTVGAGIARLQAVSRQLSGRSFDRGDPEADALRAEAWVVLNGALRRLLSSHLRSGGRLTEEDIEDLASDLCVKLLGRIEAGGWAPQDRTGAQIIAYLSVTARHSVIDALRSPWMRRRAGLADPEAVVPSPGDFAYTACPAPDGVVERGAFVSAFLETSKKLRPRECRVWLLSVLQNLTHQELCSHPKLGLARGNLCVVLHRATRKVRRSMQNRGFEGGEIPPGTLAALREAALCRKGDSGSVTLAPRFQ